MSESVSSTDARDHERELAAGSTDGTHVRDVTRVVLRPTASPLPLGFFAFAVGLALVTAVDLAWLDRAEAEVVPLLLLGFVAPLQAAAAIGAYLARDTSAASGFGLFAAEWVATGVVGLSVPVDAVPALGVLLLALTAVVAALAALSLEESPLVAVVLGASAARALFRGIHHLAAVSWLSAVNGWLALAVAALGFYAATALLVEDMKGGRSELPLGRRHASRRALTQGLDEQVRHLPHEAGVRRRL